LPGQNRRKRKRKKKPVNSIKKEGETRSLPSFHSQRGVVSSARASEWRGKERKKNKRKEKKKNLKVFFSLVVFFASDLKIRETQSCSGSQ